MAHNIDVGLLRAFLAVVDTGGMTSSARVLNLTQAAVSLQIKRLEEHFGCQLFERDRKGIKLTPSGQRLVVQARRMVRNNDEVWSAMNEAEFEGEIRLGMPSDFVRCFGVPILKLFDQVWPRVRVSLVCDTSLRLLEKLDAAEIDLTFAVEKKCGHNGETLLSDPLVWVGAKGGQAFERDPLPISTDEETCALRPYALKALADAGRAWRWVCEDKNFDPILATLEADIAVAPLLACTVPPGFEILGERHGLPPLLNFWINLYVPHAGPTPLAAELATHIRDVVGVRSARVA
jgi:DNA-binding transcriptional LysR family regulator